MIRIDALSARAFCPHGFGRFVVVLAALILPTVDALAQDPAQADAELSAASVAATPRNDVEGAFLAENTVAMDRMMADMAATPTGDVDRDFVAMMTPHHQGAIDMAKALLRHGGNATLKRLAQEIIVTQQQEIAAMRIAIGEPPFASSPMPTEPVAAAPMAHDHSMSMK
ncbi:uncharacterized protein (DUF305 family) [Methylopila capsulata]|uniref:Uncharacterized protein (DUF305 family) n=1 Tax=Methylopila capsulata TaxID=61654 RepID=A0A9W6IVU9_9HYPH|nr:DUF305 domain-containing protein [Methylopila capsulata]MBM7852348.1 uncharacterized protein (DUF305 family) [Methylopila capsulata]GLK56557.1 hypothetical protein GCM10008170_25760 [Methylopila capsulata]